MGMAVGLDVLVPVLVAAVLASAVTGYLQVGGLLTLQPLQPKLERIDPVRGTKNLFSQRQWIEFLKSLFKLAVVGYVVVRVLSDGVRGVSGLAARDASAALSAAGELVTVLLFRVAGAVLALAIVDLLYQRWRHQKDQRMTKDEVKREYKEAEGDPHAKQQRERLHREIVEHDSVEQVRLADVLVVNPTHIAVALRYDADEADAPEVVARGQEHLAERMIAAAHQAGVPVMRDVPLARSLFALELGEQIPETLFEAVAAVLHAAWAESGKPR
jgi:flagellar biosynthetic protein FlhB